MVRVEQIQGSLDSTETDKPSFPYKAECFLLRAVNARKTVVAINPSPFYPSRRAAFHFSTWGSQHAPAMRYERR